MTPLARRILKNLTLPLKRREEDAAGLGQLLYGAAQFDLTAVFDLLSDLADKIAYDGQSVGPLGFLPAERTWIEFDNADEKISQRQGYLIVSKNGGRSADFYFAADCLTAADNGLLGRSGFWTAEGHQSLSLFREDGDKPNWSQLIEDIYVGHTNEEDRRIFETRDPSLIFAALALINSPRVIGRRQHMPHRGLQRDLMRKLGKPQGRFPLQAWTEIRLEVSPPANMEGEVATEACLTGHKALHFCRSHLRVRHGRLEVVRGHWRGDASLGIKQSRYSLVAPKTNKISTNFGSKTEAA